MEAMPAVNITQEEAVKFL
jgi:transposase InsO family protein